MCAGGAAAVARAAQHLPDLDAVADPDVDGREMGEQRLATVAVIVAVCGPSIIRSSTIVATKLAEFCPAGMVTVAGTATASVSLEVRLTTTSAPTVALAVTVPVSGGCPSVLFAGSVTVKTAVSLSATTMVLATLS